MIFGKYDDGSHLCISYEKNLCYITKNPSSKKTFRYIKSNRRKHKKQLKKLNVWEWKNHIRNIVIVKGEEIYFE